MSNNNSSDTKNFLVDFRIEMIYKFIIIFYIFVSILGFSVIFIDQFRNDNHYVNSFLNIYERLFDLGSEANIPTWFSSLILFISACLLFLISYYKGKQYKFQKYWKILGFIFVLLSIDELASIHEDFNNPVRSLFHAGGIFYWSWIIPAIMILIIMFFVFLKFLLSLPKSTRNLITISGIIYIGGAVGLEMIGGLLYSKHLDGSFMMKIENFFEEMMEMTGILIFIWSLLNYIKNEGIHISIHK